MAIGDWFRKYAQRSAGHRDAAQDTTGDNTGDTTGTPARAPASASVGAPAGGTADAAAPPAPSTTTPGSKSRREQLLSSAAAHTATWAWRFLLIGAALVVLSIAIGRMWVVVLPVLMGLLLATVLWPPARLLRRFMPAALASLLVIVGALLLLFALGAVLVPQVSGQSQALSEAVVQGLNDLRGLLTRPPFNLGAEQLNNVIDQGLAQLQANAQSIAGGVLTGVATAGSFLVNTVLALVLCFFYLKDGPKFIPWVSGLVGRRAAPHVAEVSRRTWDTLSGFIRAQAIVGLVDAIAIGLGLLIMGVPLALPLAVLIFFGAFVPIIGAFVTGALAALVALVFNGVVIALVVVALVLVVQQLEGNVLQPILVGRALDLHAALVILAVTAGGSLFGIIGAFLAVPVVAVGTTIIRYGRSQLDEAAVSGPVPPGG
jgi:predicted PurR-regulated permease PerM